MCTLTETKRLKMYSMDAPGKNSAYHDGIKRTPYKAMFGSEIKVGLKSSSLPHEVTNQLTTEEDLQEVIDNFKENDLNDEQQTSELHTSENKYTRFQK